MSALTDDDLIACDTLNDDVKHGSSKSDTALITANMVYFCAPKVSAIFL